MNSNDLAEKRLPSILSSAAFASSLIGGITIFLFGSIMPWLFFANYHHDMPGMMSRRMGMIGAGGGMMTWFGSGYTTGVSGWLSSSLFLISIISGILVIIGAIMIYKRPRQIGIWSVVVLAFSILGLIGTGYSILGATLGIIGGVIGLSNSSILKKQ